MSIVRPRLTDYYGILIPQARADFAIPFLDEDIPLYLDPFLLWRSPSQQDNALHTAIINSFNHLGDLEKNGKRAQAIQILTQLSECDEVGFGPGISRAPLQILAAARQIPHSAGESAEFRDDAPKKKWVGQECPRHTVHIILPAEYSVSAALEDPRFVAAAGLG